MIGGNPHVPNTEDWKISHYILLQWAENKKVRDKNKLRKMQLDCLIAAMAINKSYYIVTHDKDFKDIKETERGKALKMFYP